MTRKNSHTQNPFSSFSLPEGVLWWHILLANAAVFVAVFFASLYGFRDEAIRLLALTPSLALFEPWTFVSSMFLHLDPTHIFFNMFALFMFGPLVEHRIGTKKFAVLYFAGGLIGGIAYILGAYFFPWGNPSIPALGASGAIFALMGALALLEPNLMIFMMFIPMPMWMAAIAWLGLEFFGLANAEGVANEAHLGGLIFGFAYAYNLRRQASKFVEEYEYEKDPNNWR